MHVYDHLLKNYYKFGYQLKENSHHVLVVCAVGSCFCCLKCLQKIINLAANRWSQIGLFMKKVPTPIITPINQQPLRVYVSESRSATDHKLTQGWGMDLPELWVRQVWRCSCRGRDLLNSSPREGGSR